MKIKLQLTVLQCLHKAQKTYTLEGFDRAGVSVINTIFTEI
jgi:hypothetical protein